MISSERTSLKRFIKIYQKFIKRLSKSHPNESNIVLRSKRLFCLPRNEINKKTNVIRDDSPQTENEQNFLDNENKGSK